jgi:hypothetical protein
MTAVISIFVAIILTARAWRAAHRFEGGVLPGEHFLIFLLMTGMFHTGGFEFGMNLSAWRLLVWIALLGLVLVKGGPNLSRHPSLDLPVLLYGVFLLWCILRLIDAPSMSYGLRNLLKIIYPFLVLLLARKVARPGHLGTYVVPMIGASLVISLFTSGLSEKIPYLVYNPLLWGVFWPRATFADHAAIMVGVILVVLWGYRGYMPAFSRRIYTIGAIWLILSPLAVACRTGLLATAASISAYALARYRAKAVPLIGGLFLLGTAAFALLPWVRANTFYETENIEFGSLVRGNVDISNINSSGRFAMWQDLLDRFYHPHRLVGSGLGAVQEHMYSHEELYPVIVPHSDYVMLLCDTGIVGLALYLGAAFSALCLAVKYARAGTTMEQRAAAALVLVGFLACLCATSFDNVFNYTLPVHSLPFAFTGILLGMIRNVPSFPIVNPWLWSREYIWSRLLPLRRSGLPPVPQTPPRWPSLYPNNPMKAE